MKLEDWIKDWLSILAIYGPLSKAKQNKLERNLHVIETCGECRWWDKTRSGNGCIYESRLVTQCSKDDGCIHFEVKGKPRNEI